MSLHNSLLVIYSYLVVYNPLVIYFSYNSLLEFNSNKIFTYFYINFKQLKCLF